MTWMPVRDALLSQIPSDPRALAEIGGPGIYAWWDEQNALAPFIPSTMPTFDATVPLYVGIAKKSFRQRADKMHFTKTRVSTLRRSLTALLRDELDLLPGATPGPSLMFGLSAAAEVELTTWMMRNLTVTWFEMPNPSDVERAIIGDLLPPLNYDYAKGSPYRDAMQNLRREFRNAVR